MGRKRRGLSPEYKLRWIEQPRTRTNGWVDILYIHKYVPKLICRSIRAVEMYEKYGLTERLPLNTYRPNIILHLNCSDYVPFGLSKSPKDAT
ncbi:hypothetical protein P8452_20136 [Trifolium repens]|nr:hypothetical protein P8452_20136 [Trifolium repens]